MGCPPTTHPSEWRPGSAPRPRADIAIRVVERRVSDRNGGVDAAFELPMEIIPHRLSRVSPCSTAAGPLSAALDRSKVGEQRPIRDTRNEKSGRNSYISRYACRR